MRSLFAITAAVGALTLTGCTGAERSAAPSAAPSVAPSPARTGGAAADWSEATLLERGSLGGQPWQLSARRDRDGRLCMTLASGAVGSAGSVTCGLPEAAGAGYRLGSVPGPGKRAFYFAMVPRTAAAVRLEFVGTGAEPVTVETKAMPEISGEHGRFFVIAAPAGVRGVAVMSVLDDRRQPVSADR